MIVELGLVLGGVTILGFIVAAHLKRVDTENSRKDMSQALLILGLALPHCKPDKIKQ